MVCKEIEDNELEEEKGEERSNMDAKRKVGGCRKEGITYSITCYTCQKSGKVAKYLGETSRTCYLKGIEHMEGRAACKEDNPLYKHDQLYHQIHQDGGEYYMEMDRQFLRPLQRQTREMVLIEMSKIDILLNSKSEYNGSKGL